MVALTDTQKAVLDFERQLWKYAGAKEAAIRAKFGMSLVRYNQVVAHLLSQPEALAYAPHTTRRLQRLRDKRMAQRGHVYGRAG